MSRVPPRSFYTSFVVQIPWYIGLPCVVALGFGFLYWGASRAPYYPLKYPKGFWDVQGELGAEDMWLTAGDGTRLHGWWVSAPKQKLVTLYLHGNAGNVTHRFLQMREVTAAGSSILMLDYRGYGKSEGSPSEKGLYKDADAAYEYLIHRGFSPRRILLHGESIGTAVAIDLASRRECAGVVLESAFTAGSDLARSVLPILGPLLFRGFDTRLKIAKVHAPILFFHGDRDDIVPLSMGRELYDAALAPKTFFEVPGAGHNDLPAAAGPNYRQKLQEFYASLTP